MKKIFIAICLYSVIAFPQKKQITLDDIFLSDKFTPAKVENVRWKPNGSAFAFTRSDSFNSIPDIYIYNIFSQEEKHRQHELDEHPCINSLEITKPGTFLDYEDILSPLIIHPGLINGPKLHQRILSMLNHTRKSVKRQ